MDFRVRNDFPTSTVRQRLGTVSEVPGAARITYAIRRYKQHRLGQAAREGGPAAPRHGFKKMYPSYLLI